MNTADSDLLESLKTAQPWDAARWASWYVDAFRRNRTAPLRIGYGDLLTAIDRLFLASDDHSFRRRMKEGLVQAIREWDADLYGAESYRVLQQLGATCAQLKNTDVVPHLISILSQRAADLRQDRGPFLSAADTMISVLAGFAPDPKPSRIEPFFEPLLFDNTISVRYSSTLAVGLCACNPERFPEAFQRYFQRRATAPHFFRDAQIIAQFQNEITHGRLLSMVGQLPLQPQQHLIEVSLKARIMSEAEVKNIPFDETRQVKEQAAMRYEQVRSHALSEANKELEAAGGVERVRRGKDVETLGNTDILLMGLEVQLKKGNAVLQQPQPTGQYGRATES